MNNIPENEEILRPSLSHLPDSYGQWLLSYEVSLSSGRMDSQRLLFSATMVGQTGIFVTLRPVGRRV